MWGGEEWNPRVPRGSVRDSNAGRKAVLPSEGTSSAVSWSLKLTFCDGKNAIKKGQPRMEGRPFS